MKAIKGPGFAFLLFGLLLIKTSAFHVYTHLDNAEGSEEHCELCILAIQGQHSQGLVVATFALGLVIATVLFERTIRLRGLFLVETRNSATLFSRPPPIPAG